MPIKGHYQIQITRAEHITITAALEFFRDNMKAARLSEMEKVILDDTIKHMGRAKLYE